MPDAGTNDTPLMLDWLIGNWEFFGFTGQNWMVVFAGGLLLYIVVLIVAARGQPRPR